MALGPVGIVDGARLQNDVTTQLNGRGFITHPLIGGLWKLSAQRDTCKVFVTNGDDTAHTIDALRLEAPGASVLVGYRGDWQPAPPGDRAAIEREFQQQLYAVGLRRSRPAVLALALFGTCPTPNQLLAGLRAWARH